MGPLAVVGSAGWLCWMIWTFPAMARRRAAARAGSRRDSQACLVSKPPISFAASEGQMVLSWRVVALRSWRSWRMAASRARSALSGCWPRQASEQNLTTSQSRACWGVQRMGRRQVLQSLSLCGVMRSGLGLRSGMVVRDGFWKRSGCCPESSTVGCSIGRAFSPWFGGVMLPGASPQAGIERAFSPWYVVRIDSWYVKRIDPWLVE